MEARATSFFESFSCILLLCLLTGSPKSANASNDYDEFDPDEVLQIAHASSIDPEAAKNVIRLRRSSPQTTAGSTPLPTNSTGPDKACLNPVDPGQCELLMQRWYFDAATQNCSNFTYTGCGGNPNRFVTKNACLATCRPNEDFSKIRDPNGDIRSEPNLDTQMAESPVCNLPIEEGTCDQSYDRFAWNSQLANCVLFNYSGCGGNNNRFEESAFCYAICGIDIDPFGDVCVPLPIQGPCTAELTRWHYNAWTNQCKEFTYGGCYGNQNNFVTKAECEQKCSGGNKVTMSPRRTTAKKKEDPKPKQKTKKPKVVLVQKTKLLTLETSNVLETL